MEHFQNRIDGGLNMRFGSPKRGEPHFSQPQLQWTEIAPPQSQVMEKIAGARLETEVNVVEARAR